MLRWLTLDALTLSVGPALPLIPQWPIRTTIGQVEIATATLQVKNLPNNWERSILPMASVLICFDDADPLKSIQWGGIVTGRKRASGSGVVELNLATAEYYFDRRSISADRTYTSVGQNAIAADLVNSFVADTGGMPFTVRYTDPGTVRTLAYKGAAFAKVLGRLQELSALPGGAEFTVSWEWDPDGEHAHPVLQIATRIGNPAPASSGPPALFSMPGCVVAFELIEDYSDGKGANRVTTYSSGQGSTIPTSGPVDGPNPAGRPIVEFIDQPAASLTDVASLQQYANQDLAVMVDGQSAVTLTANRATAPALGNTWGIGDDVQYAVDPMPEFPNGVLGVGRALGIEHTLTTIAPILAVPGV